MRIALGTSVVIEAEAADEAGARRGLAAAFAQVEAVAAAMDPEAPASDVARLNRALPGEPVEVGELTAAVLRFAGQLHRHSEGAFDPCLPGRPGTLAQLELRGEGPRTWARCTVPLTLDLGGIAKGFAVDRAVAALRAAGCTRGLVNAGGDLRAFGAARSVLLRCPRAPLQPVVLHEAALAVSDYRQAHAPRGHRGYYRRGAEALRPFAHWVAVRAADAMRADALTKCVLLCPPSAADALLRACGAERLG